MVVDGAGDATAHGIVLMIDCAHCSIAVKSGDGLELVFLVVGINGPVDGEGVACGIIGGRSGVGEGSSRFEET